MPVRKVRNIAQGAAPAIRQVASNMSGQYTAPARVAPTPMMDAARKPKPKKGKGKGKGGGVPGINQYLAGDTTYQDQTSQLMKQLEQFRTSNTGQTGMVNQDFTTAAEKMARQKQQDLGNMQGDYAARGLLNSGLLTKSIGDYDTNYQSQYNDLATGQQRSLSQLLEDLANYTTENSASLTAAKQDAIRRRAQKYGITTG